MSGTQIRTKGRGGFTTSLNTWIESADLDPYDFRLAMWLASHTAEFSTGISQAQISRVLSMSQERVQKSLARLVELGLAVVEDGGFRGAKRVTFDKDEWARPLATREVTSRQTGADLSPHETPEEQGEEQGDTSRGEVADLAFEQFWRMYPRKINKPGARMKWRTRVLKPSVVLNDVIEGLRLWVEYWDARCEPEFIPYPATWLNQERWNDAPPAVMRHPSFPRER